MKKGPIEHDKQPTSARQKFNQKTKAENELKTKAKIHSAPKKDYGFSISQTKKITITAILIALSFVMPYFMPTLPCLLPRLLCSRTRL